MAACAVDFDGDSDGDSECVGWVNTELNCLKPEKQAHYTAPVHKHVGIGSLNNHPLSACARGPSRTILTDKPGVARPCATDEELVRVGQRGVLPRSIGSGATCRPGGGGGGPKCEGRDWQGTRGAHREDAVHICDAGRVEAQRLVEHRRILPSRKGSIGKRGAKHGGRREGVGAVAAQAACREDPTVEVAGRARAERTSNILYMTATLDVSKLSGWLNAAARCRAQREASVGRGATCGAGKLESAWGRRGRREQCAGGTQLWRIAGRARAERTSNMLPMFVTLDVSKLSGWLNAAAPCRVKEKLRKKGDMRAGRQQGRWAAAAQAACWEDPTMEAAGRARAERTVNISCMVVTLDVSRLSGWLNANASCRVGRLA
eukprot:scaffold49868_cov57-Phaeocystis_antarctica.AAC.3